VIANLEAAPELPARVSVRIVHAGDVKALRAALEEEGGCVLLLAGADARLVGETLRKAAEPEPPPQRGSRRR
jgi:hypothetical protein